MRAAVGVALLVLATGACGEMNSSIEQAADTPAPPTSGPTEATPPPAATPPARTTTTTTTTTTTATTTTALAVSGPPTTVGTVVRSGANVSPEYVVGDPLAISIPAIGVSSVLVPSGLVDDGTIAVPKDPSVAGWFTGGSRPGERGPAVIVGHVDSKRGPGVFWRLRDLPIGAVVTIETTTAPQQFVVEEVEQYPKDQFPTVQVYGSVPRPALRLITCGGSFDRSIGHYRDNIVVYLSPVLMP